MESEATPEAEKSLQRSEERSREIELEIASDPAEFRLLTGDRPTGRLHIGHYFGSLEPGVVAERRDRDLPDRGRLPGDLLLFLVFRLLAQLLLKFHVLLSLEWILSLIQEVG